MGTILEASEYPSLLSISYMKNIVTFIKYGENVHITQGNITTVKPAEKVMDNTCGKIAVLLDELGAGECERCDRKNCIINTK